MLRSSCSYVVQHLSSARRRTSHTHPKPRSRNQKPETQNPKPGTQAPSQSIWSRQFGKPGLIFAPTLTDLHHTHSMSTWEWPANPTEAELDTLNAKHVTSSLQPETRKQKTETRNTEPGTLNSTPETRNQIHSHRNSKPGTLNPEC